VADLGMASGVTGDGAGLLEVKTPFCKSHRIKTVSIRPTPKKKTLT
jgi:hypothetical protein